MRSLFPLDLNLDCAALRVEILLRSGMIEFEYVHINELEACQLTIEGSSRIPHICNINHCHWKYGAVSVAWRMTCAGDEVDALEYERDHEALPMRLPSRKVDLIAFLTLSCSFRLHYFSSTNGRI